MCTVGVLPGTGLGNTEVEQGTEGPEELLPAIGRQRPSTEVLPVSVSQLIEVQVAECLGTGLRIFFYFPLSPLLSLSLLILRSSFFLV